MTDRDAPTPGDTATAMGPDGVAIDRAKVARLRRAIAAGTYAVDPDAIAAALVAAGVAAVLRT